MSLFSLKGASIWTLGITLSLLVAGCATTSLPIQGCIGGTVAGGAIGALISKEGAIIGAIGGCIAGLFVGNYFEKRREQYASQQQAIIEETAWNRNMARKLRETNAQLAKSIQQYEGEVERIKNMRMNDKMRKNLLREHKKRFEQEFGNVLAVKQRLKTEVGESNKRYQQHQAGADPDASAQWKDQITAFEQESNRLDNKLNRIIATTDSL
jgi:uncharacterized protein YcfJ